MTTLSDILNDYKVQILEVLEVSPTEEQEEMLEELADATYEGMKKILERIL